MVFFVAKAFINVCLFLCRNWSVLRYFACIHLAFAWSKYIFLNNLFLESLSLGKAGWHWGSHSQGKSEGHSFYARPFLFIIVLLVLWCYQETLEVAEGKYRQKMKERNVFLFEKLIIIAEVLEREGGVTELRYQNSIKVGSTLLENN